MRILKKYHPLFINVHFNHPDEITDEARRALNMLADAGNAPRIGWKPRHGTPYINSIAVDQQPRFPGDLAHALRRAVLAPFLPVAARERYVMIITTSVPTHVFDISSIH